MTADKLFLILFLGICVYWAITSTYSWFTKHAYHKVKYFRMIPTKSPIPILEVTFVTENGETFTLAKSAENMDDTEQLLVWSAYNNGGAMPLLIHIHITPWQRLRKIVSFTLEPALLSEDIQYD